MEIFSSFFSTPAPSIVLIILAFVAFIKFRKLKRKFDKAQNSRSRATRKYPKSKGKAPAYPQNKPTNADRLFDHGQKLAGHKRAGKQCEYTNTRTRKRCSNASAEGDHFYPYSKGGATSLMNFVSACKIHNQQKSGDLWEHEKEIIELRRASYFLANEAATVGDWRATGYRLTFRHNQKESCITAKDAIELVQKFKTMSLQKALPAVRTKLSRIANPGQLCDFLWDTTGYFLKELEGIDLATKEWIPLRSRAANK